MIYRNYTNISRKDLGQLIALKDAASRSVAKRSLFNRKDAYYLAAIRLYLILCFKASASTGVTDDLLIKSLASEARCCRKTVMASLDKLKRGGLIDYTQNPDTHMIIVSLTNHDMLAARRGEGGFGYIVFSRQMLDKLLELTSINDMRLLIRTLIECEEQRGTEATITVKDILKSLPGYLRPIHLRKSISLLDEFIAGEANENRSAYIFYLKDTFKGKQNRTLDYATNESKLRKTIEAINQEIQDINNYYGLSKSSNESQMSSMVAARIQKSLRVSFDWMKAEKDGLKELPQFVFGRGEFRGIAEIATQLDFESVIGAIREYLQSNVFKGRGKRGAERERAIQKIAGDIFRKNNDFGIGEIDLINSIYELAL